MEPRELEPAVDITFPRTTRLDSERVRPPKRPPAASIGPAPAISLQATAVSGRVPAKRAVIIGCNYRCVLLQQQPVCRA